MSKIVGVDLGTTYSCVGVWKNSKVEILVSSQGNRVLPSVVAFTDKELLVGDAAKNQAIFDPTQSIYDSKRMLGKTFDDETIASDKKVWPFSVLRDESGNIIIQVKYLNKTKQFRPEEISSFILQKLREIGEKFLGYLFNEVVITVPAYFNDGQRLATKDAGVLAGLNVQRLVNEPTAACIAYGMHRKEDNPKHRSCLVFDFGGGTYDVSILAIDDGIFEVKATNGDTHLGGQDIDRILTDFFVDEFERMHPGRSIRKCQRAIRRLKAALERAKRTVSTKASTLIELDCMYDADAYRFTLTKARLEEQCTHLFKRLIKPLHTVLMDAGFEKKKISDIIVIGGSTRIPAVQKLLKEEFKDRLITNSINPDEAVAYGAAVQGAILDGIADTTIDQVLLLDVIPIGIGIETSGKFMEIVVPKNTTVPTYRTQFFCASKDFQNSVQLCVYEGERAIAKDNHFLGSFDVKLIPVERKKSKIKVSFNMDVDGIMTITATDLRSRKGNSLKISADKRTLSKKQIKAMLEDAKANKAVDRTKKECEPARLDLTVRLAECDAYMEKLDRKKISSEAYEAFQKVHYNIEWWSDYDTKFIRREYIDKLSELNVAFWKLKKAKRNQ